LRYDERRICTMYENEFYLLIDQLSTLLLISIIAIILIIFSLIYTHKMFKLDGYMVYRETVIPYEFEYKTAILNYKFKIKELKMKYKKEK